MTTAQNIQVIESWNITTLGIIVEIFHNLDGLKNGTIVKSTVTNKEWRIEKRLLFYHILERQIKFPNEITTYIHLSFANIEEQIISSKNILDKEAQNIFQYQLQPIEHNSKPNIDDILKLVVNAKPLTNKK